MSVRPISEAARMLRHLAETYGNGPAYVPAPPPPRRVRRRVQWCKICLRSQSADTRWVEIDGLLHTEKTGR